MGVVKITSNHNHDIENAHVLSFRPQDPETKEKFFEYFDENMSPAGAKAHHFSQLILKPQAQILLADASVNPKDRTVYGWFDEWRRATLGPREGEELWDKINENKEKYAAAGTTVSFLLILNFFT